MLDRLKLRKLLLEVGCKEIFRNEKVISVINKGVRTNMYEDYVTYSFDIIDNAIPMTIISAKLPYNAIALLSAFLNFTEYLKDKGIIQDRLRANQVINN